MCLLVASQDKFIIVELAVIFQKKYNIQIHELFSDSLYFILLLYILNLSAKIRNTLPELKNRSANN